ncbi:MAG: ABC transporter ATP-binding protein [Lachnospiraceae bacterium]|nr:ABC transporter ATP-binding protein [Lachnospiraceae bacterium]
MITVENLTKYYGPVKAVSDLSFTIEEGQVYGLLGPNGAGKSTTMNIMTGCLSPTSGSIHINGIDLFEEPEKAKKLIGYLPEQPPLYMNETPLEYLRFVGQAKGLKGAELSGQIRDVIAQTGLEHMKNRLISQLSKGYRQRVGIAQALLGNPAIVILDEPTVGLDPIQIVEIRTLIRDLGKTHTVIISSHILSEMQAVCDKVLIISNGTLAAFDTPNHLESILSGSDEITIRTLASEEQADALLSSMQDVDSFECTKEEDSLLLRIRTSAEDLRQFSCSLFFAFAKEQLPVFELTAHKGSLEDVFMELTEQTGTAGDETADSGESEEIN